VLELGDRLTLRCPPMPVDVRSFFDDVLTDHSA
jgi:hypothetical protein